jgi:hypothetical protein
MPPKRKLRDASGIATITYPVKKRKLTIHKLF